MQPQKSLCSSLRGEKFSCVGACGFRREGVKLSEVGEGYRRAQPCAQGWMVYGVARHFFSVLFRLIFAAFALALIAGGKRDPTRPVWYRARTPSAFFARRRKWRRSRFACLLSLPLCRRGDSLSRSRGSCRHDSPPRPVAQGLRANFSTACSKVIFYYKWGNRDSEFPCCFGFSSRDCA